MKFLLKLVVLVVVVGGGVAAYTFWEDLTPGEKYHMVDKARAGDVEGFVDTAKFKAGEHFESQKRKAAETLKELSDKAVDATANEAKKAAHAKIDEELATASKDEPEKAAKK